MTLQTILVPLPVMPRDRGAPEAAHPLDVGPLAAAEGPCVHAGRCDRDACGQTERVIRHCPSEDSPASAL